MKNNFGEVWKVKRAPLFILMALTACFMVFGGDIRPAEAKTEVKWRFAVPWPRPVLQKAFDRFCAEVKTNSGGRMEITLFPDGLLGAPERNLCQRAAGRDRNGHARPLREPRSRRRGQLDALDGLELRRVPSPSGLRTASSTRSWKRPTTRSACTSCTRSAGRYGLGNNVREIRKPADLKNLKLRVSSSLGMVRALGNMGKGTGMSIETIAWSELYNALSRKVVDGCWSTTNLLVDERHSEVMKYYTDMGFAWDAAQVHRRQPGGLGKTPAGPEDDRGKGREGRRGLCPQPPEERAGR